MHPRDRAEVVGNDVNDGKDGNVKVSTGCRQSVVRGRKKGSGVFFLEPQGSRRLSSQSLLDVRVSRTISFGGLGRIELLVDVLNALNDTAAEGLGTDNLFSPNFGQPTVFMDPRRAMLGVRLNLGQ